MLRGAILSFIVALISSALSLGDIAASAADISIILFFCFPLFAMGSLARRRLFQVAAVMPGSESQPSYTSRI